MDNTSRSLRTPPAPAPPAPGWRPAWRRLERRTRRARYAAAIAARMMLVLVAFLCSVGLTLAVAGRERHDAAYYRSIGEEGHADEVLKGWATRVVVAAGGLVLSVTGLLSGRPEAPSP